MPSKYFIPILRKWIHYLLKMDFINRKKIFQQTEKENGKIGHKQEEHRFNSFS